MGFVGDLLKNKKEIVFDDMKYLIVGLGNIGADYANTRHNIGFDVVDALAHKKDEKFTIDKLGSIAEIKHKGRKLILLKPSTFMNLSGKAINFWMTKEKIKPDNLLVIVDDLHLDLGVVKLKGKGSDGGHNGLKSIQEKLGGNKYPRLRVGIGNDFHPGHQVDFVLGKWKNHEEKELPDVIDKAVEGILQFVSVGMSRAMNGLNGK